LIVIDVMWFIAFYVSVSLVQTDQETLGCVYPRFYLIIFS